MTTDGQIIASLHSKSRGASLIEVCQTIKDE
jgi:hypothetical protein